MSVAQSHPRVSRPRTRATSPYQGLFRSPPVERIALIKDGVPADDAKRWLELPALSRAVALKALDLPAATFNKKVRAKSKLTPAESERVVGFARLVGQVEDMVATADTPNTFDARTWLARWLTEPLPAFGGTRPIDYMDTMEGQSLVSQTLSKIEGGAYA